MSEKPQVVILAGGTGRRMAPLTEDIPKPLISIAGVPIVTRVMKQYAKFGHRHFLLAVGRNPETFLSYFEREAVPGSGKITKMDERRTVFADTLEKGWTVEIISTGYDSKTAERLVQIKKYLDPRTFMMTYADGLSSLDLQEEYDFHRDHGRVATVSAVHPTSRFGHLELDGSKIVGFREKPLLKNHWISGGFFVLEPKVFDFFEKDARSWERHVLPKLAAEGELFSHRHEGFWHCMDTPRERDLLEKYYQEHF